MSLWVAKQGKCSTIQCKNIYCILCQSFSCKLNSIYYNQYRFFCYSLAYSFFSFCSTSHSHSFSQISVIWFSWCPLFDGAAVCRDLAALVLRRCQSSVQLQHPFRVRLKAYQLGNSILCPDQSRQQLHKASKFFSHTLFCVLWCSPHRYCTGKLEWWNPKLPPRHTKQLSAIISILNESPCQALTFYLIYLFIFIFYHF